KRTGTPAATMENQVEEPIIKDRFNRLLAVVNPMDYDFMQRYIGHTMEVLFEDTSKTDKTVLSGRTDNGLLVHTHADSNLIGQFVHVKITGTKSHYLMGELV
ncbi:MAG: TRAM domain-containing protein, partial [Lachnospiraceae bacterium]